MPEGARKPDIIHNSKQSEDTNYRDSELVNPSFSQHGYIQVYTGDGKGKTTASLGLTMRALGRGWNVLIVLFAKGGNGYGELFSFRELSPKLMNQLTIIQAGMDRIVYSDNITEKDRDEVTKGWNLVKEASKSGKYQLIVLDEANIAVELGLIDLEEMKNFLLNKPPELEIVLTGRHAHPEIIKIAHLVSEINPIKHYWNIGVEARKGIEY
ncbi:MAG: cob(I)yrinic acid a,c-diamide adenosyltransferase [Candidatus Gastranaerophilales bacterium]|nr:cob(I)yrinic acid a,c-diamide adenosyltransferase [Candidatus Gastranaerophilales bacterium]